MNRSWHGDYAALLEARDAALASAATPLGTALFHLFSDTGAAWAETYAKSLNAYCAYYDEICNGRKMPNYAREMMETAAAADASRPFENVIRVARAYVADVHST